jgi:asparagine synthase (glutamine-hydrolysing)
VAAGRTQVTFRTPYLDNRIVALAYQMPAALRKSSLAAAQFIHAHNPAMSAIPTDRGFTGHNTGPGFLARRLFAEVTFKTDYYFNEGLPRKLSLFNPPFRFFAEKTRLAGNHKYLHYSRWFRAELGDYVKTMLSGPLPDGEKLWNQNFVSQMAGQHGSGHKNYSAEINAVLTLEAVSRLLLKANWPSPN